MTGVRFTVRAGSSLRHRIQTGPGSQTTSYPMGTEESSPGVERPGCEAHRSPLSSAEVNNAWSYTCAAPYDFMVWNLVKHWENFTFTIKKR